MILFAFALNVLIVAALLLRPIVTAISEAIASRVLIGVIGLGKFTKPDF